MRGDAMKPPSVPAAFGALRCPAPRRALVFPGCQSEQNLFSFSLARCVPGDTLAPSVEPPMASTARCQSDALHLDAHRRRDRQTTDGK